MDTVHAGKYDNGKMWTFDFPPIDYFKNTYQFTPDTKWFDEARLSALRFANYCSASFVSADGLVMTNHHCARESATEMERPGENFNRDGFYAQNLKDERKVPGLYVDQLVKIEEVTTLVQEGLKNDSSKKGILSSRDSVYKKITTTYKNKNDWKGLELQVIQFYNGGKYTLYGFKRYNDVRLVFVPEMNLGFFGGDYDNFTYPRYDLDCSFFRVYNDQGHPVKTIHFFKFSQTGANENEPVFVIGNPGRTNRLSTISDLEYERDKLTPIAIEIFQHRSLVLQAFNEKAKNDSLINEIFKLENSIKARKGQLDGLRDPYLMARKSAFEKKFKSDLSGRSDLADKAVIWDDINNDNKLATKLDDSSWYLFTPSARYSGNLFALANGLTAYALLKRTNEGEAETMMKRVLNFKAVKFMELEEGFLAAWLQELREHLGNDNPFVQKALNGQNPKAAAHRLISSTQLNNPQVRAELLHKDTSFINNFSDPLFDLARICAPQYVTATKTLKVIQNRLYANHSNLGRLLFVLYGTNIPPDATFSLRISDGVVKSYPYNGTIAPVNTTFYGMYDRYYSFKKQYPWALPKRWQNPPSQLLSIPMDFITTNDIIGGNSGSPMINKNLEIVGLAFDGNMESLPGEFIFLTDANRTVGVTSQGIIGALRYIYKADRLLKELTHN